jgi:hypothetical protein
MSNCDTQLGWFFMMFGPYRKVLCHRCAKCQSFTMCGDGPQRAFCCGRWITPPKQGFWGSELPRVRYAVARGLLTLPANV